MLKVSKVSAMLRGREIPIDLTLDIFDGGVVRYFEQDKYVKLLSEANLRDAHPSQQDFHQGRDYWKIDCSDKEIGSWVITAPLSLDITDCP